MARNFLVEYWDGTDLLRIGLEADDEATGIPVVALEFVDDGRLVPGYFDLTFAAVDPGVDAEVTIAAPSDNYAIHGKTATVPLTGTGGAWVYDLIPGVRIKFSDAGGFLSSWWVRLYCGAYYGNHYAGNPTGQTLSEEDGPWVPDDPSGNLGELLTGQGAGAQVHYARWRVTNVSGKRAFEVFAKQVPTAIYKVVDGVGLSYVFNTDDLIATPTESGNGFGPIPVEITFDNKTGSAIGVRFDGAYIASGVVNVDAAGAAISSAALLFDTLYRADVGDFAGLTFKVSADTEETDEGLLYVMPVRWEEMTPLVSGAPTARPNDGVEDGTTWGHSPVGLTQPGEPTREIANTGTAFIATRTIIPGGAPYAANPHPQGFIITGGLSLPAGY
jgi:hypothetical protein